MPIRIQRKRTKGFDLQAESMTSNGLPCVYVGRPSKFGNRFKVGLWFRKITPDWVVWSSGDRPFGDRQVTSNEEALALFEEYAEARLKWDKHWLEPIRGKNLACWCRTDAPCHADILLELANREEKESPLSYLTV